MHAIVLVNISDSFIIINTYHFSAYKQKRSNVYYPIRTPVLDRNLRELEVTFFTELTHGLFRQRQHPLSVFLSDRTALDTLLSALPGVFGVLFSALLTERTLMSPRGGVNRHDDQIKLFLLEHLSW
jgi:hypothetical protein